MTTYQTTDSGLVVPAHFNHPEIYKTRGPKVAEINRLANFGPDPEQQLALDVIFGVRPDGLPSCRQFCLICARQNMKTGLFKQCALGWLFVLKVPLIIWSAHEVATALESFRDLVQTIRDTPELARRVPERLIKAGRGSESIETIDGCRVLFKARSSGGGRGMTGDRVILDEGYALKPEHMAALLPTISARPGAQLLIGSSAGMASSDVLRGYRDIGRAGTSKYTGYMEFCAPEDSCLNPTCSHSRFDRPEGCALDRMDYRQMANPAMGRRITAEAIEAERETLPEEEFARERLGWWDDPGTGDPVLPMRSWSDCENPSSVPTGTLRFALDISPLRDYAAIGVAASAKGTDNKVHVEITGNKNGVDHRPGVAWLVPRLKQIRDGLSARMIVVIARGTAAESLVPELEREGFTVEPVAGPDVMAACGAFYDLVVQGRIQHLGQETLNTAISSARRRDLESGWFYARRKSAGDITPLYAVTLAAWAHIQAPQPRVRVISWDEI